MDIGFPPTAKIIPVEGDQGIAPPPPSILQRADRPLLFVRMYFTINNRNTLYKRKGKGAKNHTIKIIFKKVLTSANHRYYNTIIESHNDQGKNHVYKIHNR